MFPLVSTPLDPAVKAMVWMVPSYLTRATARLTLLVVCNSGALVFNCPSSGCNGSNRAVAGLVSANYDNSDWNLAFSNELDILNYWGGSVW